MGPTSKGMGGRGRKKGKGEEERGKLEGEGDREGGGKEGRGKVASWLLCGMDAPRGYICE